MKEIQIGPNEAGQRLDKLLKKYLKEGEFIRNISVNIRFYEGWDE